jgi:hypothetical protein
MEQLGRFAKVALTLLGIPLAALAGYALWAASHPVEPEHGLVIEPGDAPELEIDGREPHRYEYFSPRVRHP